MMNPTFYSGAINAGECIGNAWNLMTRQFWLYLGLGLVTMILAGCIPCVSLFLLGPIMGGFYFIVLRDMRNEPVDFGMLFKWFDKFVKLMAIGLIEAIPGIIAQVLRFTANVASVFTRRSSGGRSTDFLLQSNGLPQAIAGVALIVVLAVVLFFLLFAIAWGITFFFAIPIALETDLGIVDSIKLGAKAGWGNIGGLIVLFILSGLIGLAGVLALCIGIFVVAPLIYAAHAFAYRQVFPLLGDQPARPYQGGAYA